jgi:hypothetical protein
MCRLAVGPTYHFGLWVLGPVSPGINQLGHEADYSPPSSAGFKNEWSYSSASPLSLMVWTGTTLLFCLLIKMVPAVSVFSM